jgi:hypothetical protein
VPRTVGQVDPTFFDQLRQELPPSSREGVVDYWWHEGEDLSYPTLAYLQALVLAQCAHTSVRMVNYLIDYSAIPPRGTQRYARWHNAEPKSLAVSTKPTTDHAVRDKLALIERGLWTPRLAANQARRRRLAMSQGFYRLDRLAWPKSEDAVSWEDRDHSLRDPTLEAERLLLECGLVIYNPPPGAVTVLEGQAHRSPYNYSDQTIDDRGFVRAIPYPLVDQFYNPAA